MSWGCFAGLVFDFEKILISGFSLFAAIAIFLILRKKNLSIGKKMGLIYLHLFALFFPFVFMTTEVGCGLACMPCANDTLALAFYSAPLALAAAGIVGFAIMPIAIIFSKKKMVITQGKMPAFVRAQSAKLNIKSPKIYAINDAKPLAFSFKTIKSAIFVSVGLLDILKKKELEAVLLHELAHIKFQSSLVKITTALFRFSPLSLLKSFHCELSEEEEKADKFVIKVQKTDKYVKSAKDKITDWDRIN